MKISIYNDLLVLLYLDGYVIDIVESCASHFIYIYNAK